MDESHNVSQKGTDDNVIFNLDFLPVYNLPELFHICHKTLNINHTD